MNLKYRRDGRNEEEFAADIKNRTLKEKFLIELYEAEMEYLGHETEVQDNGIDNTGELQQKSTTAADYQITVDGCPFLIEVKNSPVSTKWTFKVHNLKQYAKQGADVLVFWGTGYIDKDPNKIDLDSTRFGIISHNSITKMLSEYDHYKEYMFGNKVCIKVPKKDFGKWVKPRRITHR